MKFAGSPSPLLPVLLVLLTLYAPVPFLLQPALGLLSLTVVASAWILSILYLRREKRRTYEFVKQLAAGLESAGSEILTRFSLPVVITRPGKSDAIVWYNDAFRGGVLRGRDAFGESADFLFDAAASAALTAAGSAEIRYENRFYRVFRSVSAIDDQTYAVFYFVDETALDEIAKKYERSRPVVAYLFVDNLEELLAGCKESEKAELTGLVEKEIENFVSSLSAVGVKTAPGRFMILTEDHRLKTLMDEKFPILAQVRGIDFRGRGNPTLSIGVGRGGELRLSDELAKSALDMALGRGGDQAAVKFENGDFIFFGGVARAPERRTRVRSRVVARAISELLENCDNVLIMGHRFADLDSFGAAVGLQNICEKSGKPAKVVMTRQTSLARSLLNRMEEEGDAGRVIEPTQALPLITENTLLFVVDTHRGDFVDSEEVYRACKKVIVIDHHRKTVNYIDDAVLFYHEPFSSSASEMVAELSRYMGDNLPDKAQAEALLAGIMLDTRNFVLRTGVRTFEAAAYLRSRGADPVRVKTLFSGSIETYKERARIVASAEIYRNCAISVSDSQIRDIRIVTSQAADELLTISGVNASFVLFEQDGTVHISARSMGGINVQIIMEELGGGGHQTMAAAQLPGESADNAKIRLMSVIDRTLSS